MEKPDLADVLTVACLIAWLVALSVAFTLELGARFFEMSAEQMTESSNPIEAKTTIALSRMGIARFFARGSTTVLLAASVLVFWAALVQTRELAPCLIASWKLWRYGHLAVQSTATSSL